MLVLETIIGLEVHAQMNTKSKMFCGCDNDAFGKAPNTTVCPVCMGHPGTLPAPNGEAVAKAMKAALALGSSVNTENHFDRKHYFYPDLPAGFQISQYDFPLASGGAVAYDVTDAGTNATAPRTCRIRRLHMENDAGKLTHRGRRTLLDFNRAGTPLMEIVTEPDLPGAREAVAFAQELRRILIAVGASEADMFKGMMRFDASISLREKGAATLNPRSEIKNLNSFKSLEKALLYEEKRLRALWEKEGEPLPHDITVGWLDEEEKTKMLREKETADDYRYFPEPDIPPMRFTAKDIGDIRGNMPELPRELKDRYLQLGTEEFEAVLLTDDPYLRRVFDAVLQKTNDIKLTRSLVLTQLAGFLKTEEKDYERPDAERMIALMSGLIEQLSEGIIHKNQTKEIIDEMVRTDSEAKEIIRMRGIQISGIHETETYVDRAIAENPKAVEAYKAGKMQAFGALVGWVMKETKGQADPVKVNGLLRKKLS